MADIVNGSDEQRREGIGAVANGNGGDGLTRSTVADLCVAGRPAERPAPTDRRRHQVLHAGFFVLRTPLLPFDEVARWGEALEAPDVLDDTALVAAGERDSVLLRARFAALVDRPEVAEALYLASPDLDAAIPLWREDPTRGRGPGIERALVRYFLRMACRPTPFALFGGCSVGTVGPRTRLELAGREHYRRHTTVDVDILRAAAARAVEDGGAALCPNTTLHRTAGEVRWVERREAVPAASHHLVAAPRHAALDAVLDRAATHATRSQLASAAAGAGMAPGDATELVDRLVAGQVVVPVVQVPATGDALGSLVRRLHEGATGAGVAARLAAAARRLAAVDGAGLGVGTDHYREVAAALGDLVDGADPARLCSVQLVKPAPAATLGTAVVDELRRAVTVLHRLAPRPSRPEFDRFKQGFERRYGAQEVPLLEALDEDIGVGFGAGAPTEPLLAGLSFPTGTPPGPAWGRREAVLSEKLATLPAGTTELVVDNDLVDQLAEDEALPLPGAFAVVASVAAVGEEALDAGRFRVAVEAVGGPSGAWMLGRFCAADPDLLERVREHLAAEEAGDPDAVWAEVAHLPAGRFGNVVLRPVLRGWEIPYLGASGAPADRQIAASDLALSLRDGRFVLRSTSLGRRVVPRSTTAHDFTAAANLPVYRFLCALQVAEVQGGMSWSWGALANAPFLPRVRLGRVVLARARWRVRGAELRSLAAAPETAVLAGVVAWRAARGVPRLVTLADGDRGFVVDLGNVLAVHAFLDAVRQRDCTVLEELLPGPEELCARGPEGAFVHELVVPFVAEPVPPPADHLPMPVARRTFPVGSEWLDAKVYAPASALDRVLREVVAPLRECAARAGAVDAWHFLRGADPDHHLRVRFHGPPAELREAVGAPLEAAVAGAVAEGWVRAVQLDTYAPPLERFGGQAGSALAQSIFTADSDAAAEVLRRLPPGAEGADRCWRTALAGADLLLDDLGVEGDERTAALRRRRAALAAEIGADPRLEGDLSRRFRSERAELSAWHDGARTGAGPVAELLQPWLDRSCALADIAVRWRRLADGRSLDGRSADVATRLVDESLDRLLRPGARSRLVAYDFLVRLHLSRSSRRADAGR